MCLYQVLLYGFEQADEALGPDVSLVVRGGFHHVLGRVHHGQKRTLEVPLPQGPDAARELGGQPAYVRQHPGERVAAEDLQLLGLPQRGQLRVPQPQPSTTGVKV